MSILVTFLGKRLHSQVAFVYLWEEVLSDITLQIEGMPDAGVSIKDEEARFEEERRLSYWLRFAIVYTGLLTVGEFGSLVLTNQSENHLPAYF